MRRLLLALLVTLAPGLASAQNVAVAPRIQTVHAGDTATVALTLSDAAGRSVRPTSRVVYQHDVADLTLIVAPGSPTTLHIVPKVRPDSGADTVHVTTKWRHTNGTTYEATARVVVVPPPPPLVARVDTVRLVDTVHVPVASAVDTGAILRGVCMHLPYASLEDLNADTVTITGALTPGISYWCAFAEVRDSATIGPAPAATGGLSLAGMVGSALVGTLALGAAVVTTRRRG